MVWDIGAGSGSVAIEAAQLAHLGMVYAIEPEPADIALIQANAESFGVPNVRPVLGRAPEVLASLPEPDAVFVGGTGRQVDLVLSAAYRRLCPGGSLAVNVATIEGLASAYQTLKGLAGEVRVWNVGHLREGSSRWTACASRRSPRPSSWRSPSRTQAMIELQGGIEFQHTLRKKPGRRAPATAPSLAVGAIVENEMAPYCESAIRRSII